MEINKLRKVCEAASYVSLWIPASRVSRYPRLLGRRGPRGRNVSWGRRADGKCQVVFESAEVLAFLDAESEKP